MRSTVRKIQRRGIQPLRARLGDRAIAVYAVLIVLAALYVVASMVYRERLAAVYADAAAWLTSLRPAQDAAPPPAPQAALRTRSEPQPFHLYAPPPTPADARVAATLDLQPPYQASSADTFTAAGVEIRLAMVDGAPGTGICINRYLTRFPCGLMGRASIQNLISNAALTCRPVFYPAKEVRYQCFAGDVDLGRHQVASGFARTDPLGRRAYARAEKQAHAAGRGAWSGGWTLQTGDTARSRETLFNSLDSRRNAGSDATLSPGFDPLKANAE